MLTPKGIELRNFSMSRCSDRRSGDQISTLNLWVCPISILNFWVCPSTMEPGVFPCAAGCWEHSPKFERNTNAGFAQFRLWIFEIAHCPRFVDRINGFLALCKQFSEGNRQQSRIIIANC
jgi:hypothetical protein